MYVFSDVYVRVKYILLEIFRFLKSEFWHIKHKILYEASFLNKYYNLSYSKYGVWKYCNEKWEIL